MKNRRTAAKRLKTSRGTVSKERANKGQRASSLSSIQKPVSSDLTAAVPSTEKRLNSDQILHLQRAVGNRAVANYLKGRVTNVDGAGAMVQAEGKGQILLSYQQMQDVYASFIHTLSASRGYPSSKAGMTKIHADALVRLATQVGSGNFERYLDKGGGQFTYIPPKKIEEEADRIEEEEAKEEQKSQDPMGDLYSAMRKRARSLNASATKLSSSIAHAEHYTHMLKSPEGEASRLAYHIAAGTLGLYASGKKAVDYAKKKVDPIGQAIDKGVDKAVGKKDKPEPTFEQKAEEVGQTAGTSVELMTGQLNELYQQTRPSYGAFQQALEAFGNARSAYWSANDLETLSEQLGHMINHLKAMQAAAQQYLMTCDILGIRRKAAAYMALDKAVVDALKSTVSDATGMLGGLSPGMDVAGKASKRVTNKLKDKVSDKASEAAGEAVEKVANKITGVPSGLPKKMTEKAAE